MQHDPDPHGQAALMLCECLMITLIESGVLPKLKVLEAIADVVNVKQEIAGGTEGVVVSIVSIGLLRGIERSLAATAVPEDPKQT